MLWRCGRAAFPAVAAAVAACPVDAVADRLARPVALVGAGGHVETQGGLAAVAEVAGGWAWGRAFGESPAVGWDLARAFVQVRLATSDGDKAWALSVGGSAGKSWMLGGIVVELDGGATARTSDLALGPQLAAGLRYGAFGLRLSPWAFVAPELAFGVRLTAEADLLALIGAAAE